MEAKKRSSVSHPQPRSVTEPEHLIFLAHGYGGSPDDLLVLDKMLNQLAAKKGENILVRRATTNHWRTRDGVVKGGTRLANEITYLTRAYPSLKRLSLVGHSLGGVYARYAVSLLRDEGCEEKGSGAKQGGTLAGLVPQTFMTIASPHLGIRRFMYLTVPDCMHPASALFGQSVKDLFLRDNPSDPLLLQMATSPEFLEPLALFQQRRAYANVKGDFLVPFGTAAFAPNKDALETLPALPKRSNQRWKRLKRFAVCGRQQQEKIVWESQTHDTKDFSDIDVPSVSNISRKGRILEANMAQSLDTCGWSKIGVDFGGCLPLSHNMICAQSRNKVNATIFKTGKPVMDHAAKFILSDGT